MLHIAESFFNMPETVGPYFEKNWLKSPSAFKRFIGKPLAWFADKLSSQEYDTLFHVKGLGRVGVIPPLGAVATIVIGSTFLSRVVFAIRRANSSGDYRELGDVFRRDLPTLTILVFMMDPLIKGVSHFMQRHYGIQLMSHVRDAFEGNTWGQKIKAAFKTDAKMLSYSEIESYYRLKNPKKLADIITTSLNRSGIQRAMKMFEKDHALSGELASQFKIVQQQIKSALANSPRLLHNKTKAIEEANKILATINTFESKALSTGSKVNIRNLLTNYAIRPRNFASMISLAIIVFVLGYGVVKFSEWWSIDQYRRIMKSIKEHQDKIPA